LPEYGSISTPSLSRSTRISSTASTCSLPRTPGSVGEPQGTSTPVITKDIGQIPHESAPTDARISTKENSS
jgi:hypothetical protein